MALTTPLLNPGRGILPDSLQFFSLLLRHIVSDDEGLSKQNCYPSSKIMVFSRLPHTRHFGPSRIPQAMQLL